MCNFLSAIVMENGDIITAPDLTDFHEDLMLANSIRDGGRFVRVEFIPPSCDKDVKDLSSWSLCLDETSTPDWWGIEGVRNKLESVVRRMIIDDHRPILLGGCWILVKSAKVDKVVNAKICYMLDSSQVGKMWGSSQVGEMLYGSSQVGKMWGSSQVGKDNRK